MTAGLGRRRRKVEVMGHMGMRCRSEWMKAERSLHGGGDVPVLGV